MYKGPKRKFKKQMQKKPSEYALQLIEKQKLRKAYSLREKPLKRYFITAKKQRVDIEGFLSKELERRLDNVLYRLGWALTRPQAAQLVNHGHIVVNQKRVTVPSYQVKNSDIIEVKENKKKIHIFQSSGVKLAKHTLPAWLAFISADKLKAQVKGEPAKEDFNEPINLSLILEFYSR
ncbi:MAG: 30S ribosomal protein S4 [Candidatus Colwellbacteria bacterium]|nr:30S ribosomal protein S4 [Candidatus Colwellbacteria bacterium]